MAQTAGNPTATQTRVAVGLLGFTAAAAAVPFGLLALSFGFAARLNDVQRVLLVADVGICLAAGWAYAHARRSERTNKMAEIFEVAGMLVAFGCSVAVPTWLLAVLFVPDRLAYLEQQRLTTVGLGLIAGALLGLLFAARAAPKTGQTRFYLLVALRWLVVTGFSGTLGVLLLRIAHASVGLADGDTSVRTSVLRHATAALVIAVLAAGTAPDRRRWLAIGFVAAAAGVCGAAALSFFSAVFSAHQTVTVGFSFEMGLPFLVAGAAGILVWTRVEGAALLEPPRK